MKLVTGEVFQVLFCFGENWLLEPAEYGEYWLHVLDCKSRVVWLCVYKSIHNCTCAHIISDSGCTNFLV